MVFAALSPRPLTGVEQRKLAQLGNRTKAKKGEYERALADRDEYIRHLLDRNVRAVDIAYILKVTPKAVADARDRKRGR